MDDPAGKRVTIIMIPHYDFGFAQNDGTRHSGYNVFLYG